MGKGDNENSIGMLLDMGIVPHLIKLMTDTPFAVSIPCIRILGNICNGTALQTDVN